MKLKKLYMIFSLILIFSFEIFSTGRIGNIENKMVKNDIVYLKGEETPFTGKLRGKGKTEEYLNGIKNGYFKGKIVADGENILYEGQFVEGIKHGTWTLRYPEGKTKAVIKYNYNRPNGKWTYFFEDGTSEGYEEFKNGVLHGKVVTYTSEGKLKNRMSYENGLLSGSGVILYDNGKIETETSFLLGKINGTIKIYSELGIILLDGKYKSNKRTDKWALFFRNGDLKTTIEYKNGLKNGELVVYDKSGMILDRAIFKNGVESGNENSKPPKIKDNIVEKFKKFNRSLKHENYNKILSEME